LFFLQSLFFQSQMVVHIVRNELRLVFGPIFVGDHRFAKHQIDGVVINRIRDFVRFFSCGSRAIARQVGRREGQQRVRVMRSEKEKKKKSKNDYTRQQNSKERKRT
jgi:hypothetical protein